MIQRALAVIGLWVSTAAGQPAPQFEVASIKPSADPSSGSAGSHSGKGRLTMTNVTLKRCIMGAYELGPNLIAGGPDWLDVDRYVIVAKASENTGDHDLMAMLQTLLAERFRLAVHRETRTVQAFVLEVAKGGPKLEKAEGESSTSSRRGSIEARATGMTRFAEVLSRQMDLPVVDQTGLEGAFNMKLEWTPESRKPVQPGADLVPADTGPSIFTAIQRLGLRLRAQKAPAQVLVIDHAEKPSEN